MSRCPVRARLVRFVLPTGTGRSTSDLTDGAARRRFGTVLELRDSDGRRGWGEASPLPGYARETPAHAAAVLLAWLADVGTAGLITADIDAWPMDFEDSWLARSPAARAAVVCAMLDLAGRRSGAPIRELLETRAAAGNGFGDGPTAGPTDGTVPLNALVALEDRQAAVESALAAERRGIRTLKAKLGPGARFDADLEILRAVREAVGPSIAIRLDANGLWSLAEARGYLERLTELEPEYVEEPVAGADFAELAGAPVPLAADESLRDPEVASRLLESDAVYVAVLKPPSLGGLDRCTELAGRAASNGKRTVVTHSFEGPVGHGAACELALAIAATSTDVFPSGPMACGLDRHAGLEAWKDVAVPQLSDSSLVPAFVSGHGVDPTPLLERSGAEGSL